MAKGYIKNKVKLYTNVIQHRAIIVLYSLLQ